MATQKKGLIDSNLTFPFLVLPSTITKSINKLRVELSSHFEKINPFTNMVQFHFFFMVLEPFLDKRVLFYKTMASTISLNVANFVTLKLTLENYPLWHEQLLTLAKSQDMVGILTGEKEKPTMYINTTTDETSTNEVENILEEYLKWKKKKIVSYVGGLLELSPK